MVEIIYLFNSVDEIRDKDSKDKDKKQHVYNRVKLLNRKKIVVVDHEEKVANQQDFATCKKDHIVMDDHDFSRQNIVIEGREKIVVVILGIVVSLVIVVVIQHDEDDDH